MTTTLSNLVKDIAQEFDGRVRSDYSGRCMYGETCFGIVASPYDRDAICERSKELGLSYPRIDGMGRDLIYYWPHVKD